jgi:hypothetical protein
LRGIIFEDVNIAVGGREQFPIFVGLTTEKVSIGNPPTHIKVTFWRQYIFFQKEINEFLGSFTIQILVIYARQPLCEV